MTGRSLNDRLLGSLQPLHERCSRGGDGEAYGRGSAGSGGSAAWWPPSPKTRQAASPAASRSLPGEAGRQEGPSSQASQPPGPPHDRCRSTRIWRKPSTATIARGDATRVLSFFRGFLAEAGPPQQAPSAPTGKRTYARAQIEQASRDYLRGRIPEADYQKISADIHAAVNEGRISDPPMRGIGKTRV